jgi:mannose-binding lectin 2
MIATSSCLKLAFSALLLGLPLQVNAAADPALTVGNRTIERMVQLRTHSIYAPYIDQDLQNRWWDFGGDAYINTNKHIRLTRARPSQMGWLWSRLPVTAANFEVEVEFKIGGDSTHLYGDGLAMWLATQRAMPGPVFGSVDEFNGIMIVIDTFANSRHSYSFPRIMAIKGDGQTKYDVAHDGDSQALGSCSANVRRTNVATKLKVTYLKDEYMDVSIQYKAWDEWTPCFRVTNVSLPISPFLGFSSLTGEVFDAHDIIAVTTSSAILSSAARPRDRLKDPRGSGGATSLSFTKLFLFVAACGLGWYGYKQYNLRKRRGYGGPGGAFGGIGGGFGGAGPWSSSKNF